MANVAGERRYDEVYGDTFALYSRSDMLEFIEPFKIRFERNGIDARQAFAGKRCLDAACGNGRGALFMLMNGAASVTACDFSPKNVESTQAFLKQFGFGNTEVADALKAGLALVDAATGSSLSTLEWETSDEFQYTDAFGAIGDIVAVQDAVRRLYFTHDKPEDSCDLVTVVSDLGNNGLPFQYIETVEPPDTCIVERRSSASFVKVSVLPMFAFARVRRLPTLSQVNERS